MVSEKTLHGTILYGPELEVIEGYIVIKNGIITEVAEEKTSSGNIIAPCFVNAHTHIGDSVIKDPILGKCVDSYVERDLSSLVQPPHGLKHRVLERTPYSELVESMKHSVMDMIQTGTCAFSDFREGGLTGILALHEALRVYDIECRMFGRPKSIHASDDELRIEVENILTDADGLGMSGANDMDIQVLENIRDVAKRKRKTFAIHAGENSRSDVEKALSLSPDILIHLTQADNADLKKVADEGIPVVICPRSNFITGVGMAPVRDMLKAGIDVAVGTDNVMLNSVNMFSEMELLSKVFGLEDRQVFIMCTLMGAPVLGLENAGPIIERNKAKVMILNGNSSNLAGIKNPINSIVRRGRPDDILSVII
ncbi:amidohydrolase family protein [Methanolobus halotolerans]|uniref:Chlorohydrolase n=1 Tax=Methanolobus halotolerans TaxID=2052935 RepID=A0A4E0QTD1_9EURY|nr:amidohydrolase family protein [Methanolobus halotolerans]TGC11091.1 chlorohydrolase [Methanolobus halotolerans]